VNVKSLKDLHISKPPKLQDKNKIHILRDKLFYLMNFNNYDCFSLWDTSKYFKSIIYEFIFNISNKIATTFSERYTKIFQLTQKRIYIKRTNKSNQ